MTNRFGFSGAAFAVLLFGACGGGGVAVEDLDDDAVGAQCDNLVGCGLFESTEDCVALIGDDIDLGDLIAGVEDGSIDYDGDAASECLDDIANASCDPSDEINRTDNDACDDAFTGTLDDGADCYINEQCASANCVEQGSCVEQCCLGTCQAAAVEAGIGEPCGDAGCADGGYCADGTCAALVAQGTDCTNDDMCDYGLLCLPLNDGPPQCNPAPGAGDPCVGGESCPIQGLQCSFTDNTCQPVLHEGDACDPENDLCSFFSGSCDADTMTCAAWPSVGEPCPGFLCSGGAWCDFDFETQMSECKAPLSNGTACDSDGQCDSGNCDDMTDTCVADVVCVGMGGGE
jgi:hypothetical protein